MSKIREYRGMRTDDGKWVYGAYVAYNWYPTVEDGDTEITGVVVEESNIIDYEDECLWNLVIPETVGQAIGKTDVNGKKVFDGDIVKLHLEDGVEIGQIAFDEKSYRYVFVEEGGTPYGIDNTVKLEVIGTVYEHPELLGGK